MFYRDFTMAGRSKQSCLGYIYTIGCKSFLMGSRVQSWGRDYQREIWMWCDLHLARPHPRHPVHSALSRGTGGAQVRRLGQREKGAE